MRTRPEGQGAGPAEGCAQASRHAIRVCALLWERRPCLTPAPPSRWWRQPCSSLWASAEEERPPRCLLCTKRSWTSSARPRQVTRLLQLRQVSDPLSHSRRRASPGPRGPCACALPPGVKQWRASCCLNALQAALPTTLQHPCPWSVPGLGPARPSRNR